MLFALEYKEALYAAFHVPYLRSCKVSVMNDYEGEKLSSHLFYLYNFAFWSVLIAPKARRES